MSRMHVRPNSVKLRGMLCQCTYLRRMSEQVPNGLMGHMVVVSTSIMILLLLDVCTWDKLTMYK